jgi:hypothetical protein
MMKNGASPGRLSHDGDSVGVAAEEMNVLLHPLERKALVEESCVGDPVLLYFLAGEPAKCTQLGNMSISREVERWRDGLTR